MPTIPIITYHAIGTDSSPLFTPADVFDKQLETLAKDGWQTVSVGTVADSLRNRSTLPAKACVLTFDDGYESVYTDALPRVRNWGFTATVFVISDYCGRNNDWPGQPSSVPLHRLLSWEQIEALHNAGWEVGGHTRSHPSLSQIPIAQAEDEILTAQQAIQSQSGNPVTSFAYPYGATTPAVSALVRQYFDSAVSTRLNVVNPHSDPYFLERIDSYYLTPRLLRLMPGAVFRQYFRLRRMLRGARRLFKPDWMPHLVAKEPSAPGERHHV